MIILIIGFILAYITSVSSIFVWAVGIDLVLHLNGFIADNQDNPDIDTITKIAEAKKTIHGIYALCACLPMVEIMVKGM